MSELCEGWAWPGNASKAHYFVQGRSLCLKWGYLGSSYDENQKTSAEPGPDDCRACHRKAKARVGVQ